MSYFVPFLALVPFACADTAEPDDELAPSTCEECPAELADLVSRLDSLELRVAAAHPDAAAEVAAEEEDAREDALEADSAIAEQ